MSEIIIDKKFGTTLDFVEKRSPFQKALHPWVSLANLYENTDVNPALERVGWGDEAEMTIISNGDHRTVVFEKIGPLKDWAEFYAKTELFENGFEECKAYIKLGMLKRGGVSLYELLALSPLGTTDKQLLNVGIVKAPGNRHTLYNDRERNLFTLTTDKLSPLSPEHSEAREEALTNLLNHNK